MTNTLSKIGLVVAGAVLAVASYAAIATTQVDAKGRPGANNGTIVNIASSPNFSTLATALECTGLLPLFDGNRQFTVFAPTNSAFGTLNKDNICDESVIDRETLTNILSYHVTPGIKTSKTVLNRSSMNMLNGQMVPIEGATIGGATLSSALDIRATNGVVHVLDGVMTPIQ